MKALTRSIRLLRGKVARRQQANQLRANKRNAILAEKRGLGGDNQPPFLVVSFSFQLSQPLSLFCNA